MVAVNTLRASSLKEVLSARQISSATQQNGSQSRFLHLRHIAIMFIIILLLERTEVVYYVFCYK